MHGHGGIIHRAIAVNKPALHIQRISDDKSGGTGQPYAYGLRALWFAVNDVTVLAV